MGFTDKGAATAVVVRPQQSGQGAQVILPLETYVVGGTFGVNDDFADANAHVVLGGVPTSQNGPIYRLHRISWRGLTAGSQGLLLGTTSGALYSAVNAPGGSDNLSGQMVAEGLTVQAAAFTTPNIYQVSIFYDLIIDPTLQ